MPPIDPRHRLLPFHAAEFPLSRRRFLAGLGLLAGASTLAPLVSRLGALRADTVESSRPGLGTWIRIVAVDENPARASRAVKRAFEAIDRVDGQMSIHRASSQISRVNRLAGTSSAAVDPEVLDVVERAIAAAVRSGGVYDPTVLPLMRLYRFYAEDDHHYPSDREIGQALERVSYRDITIDRGRGTLGLAHAGAGIDLGSIGKGWAVDRAVGALRESGIRSGLVDAGGNVYGLGTPDSRAAGWSVGVLHPVTKQVDRVFVLRDRAVATSGNAEQYRILSGIRVGHLFDARRGRPAQGHLSASVVAPTGVESDVMSTAAFLLGPSDFQGWPRALDVHFIG
jgi:thiamine biosynthesis lipoprotein